MIEITYIIETVCITLSSVMLFGMYLLGDKLYRNIDKLLTELKQKNNNLEESNKKLESDNKRLRENIYFLESENMTIEDTEILKENSRLRIRCDMLEEEIIKNNLKNLNKNKEEYNYVLFK